MSSDANTERSHANYYFYPALVLAAWFMLTSPIWYYFANLFYSFPFGIISFQLYRKGKRIEKNNERFIVVAIMLIGGVVFALGSLIYLEYFGK